MKFGTPTNLRDADFKSEVYFSNFVNSKPVWYFKILETYYLFSFRGIKTPTF